MKLQEVKTQILTTGLTEELFQDFTDCLKRVRSDYDRCQHCYTFGAELGGTDPMGAVRFISFGLEHYAKTDHDRYRSYNNMGIVLESAKDYMCAKECYLMAASACPQNTNLYLDLLRTELHLTGFTYSNAVAHYYDEAQKMDRFAKEMDHAALYLLIGEAVLCIHRQDAAGLNSVKNRLSSTICRSASPEAMRFLNTL